LRGSGLALGRRKKIKKKEGSDSLGRARAMVEAGEEVK
jgi:hypothetical protein